MRGHEDRIRERQTRTFEARYATREENGELRIEGYFAVYGSDYEMWPGAVETIAQGAFDGALGDDIRCLIDHDTRLVLGRNRAGTLELRVDERGLWGSVLINQDDQDAMNLYARVKRGDVTQCSFGFDILEEDTEYGPGDAVRWTIKAVKLYEVSVVTFPAYTDTGVEARRADYDAARRRMAAEWRENRMRRVKNAWR